MEQLRMVRGRFPVVSAAANGSSAVPSDIPAGHYIRHYEPGDGEDWCRCCVDGRLGVDEVSDEVFNRIMLADDRVKAENIYFLVSREDGIVGSATYQFGRSEGEAYVHMVGVVKTHWGRGLSRCLISYVTGKILENKDNSVVTLTTDDWRLPAIRTYINCGFEPCIAYGGAAVTKTAQERGDMLERWRNVFAELGIVWRVRYNAGNDGARVFEFDAAIEKTPDKDGAYARFPYDLRAVSGKGRMKASASFDGAPYEGSIVNMGVKNPDGSVCYIIGVRKDIRAAINKQPGDTVRVIVAERDA